MIENNSFRYKLTIKKNPDTCSNYVYDKFVEESQEKSNPVFVITGGSTVNNFYVLLKNSNQFNWNDSSFILTDERLVPISSEFSNIRKIQEIVDRKDFNIVPMWSRGLPQNSKIEFERFITTHTIVPELALVAMGTDGHIASLFPYNKENFESHKISQIVKNKDEAFHRLSLSYDYLLRCKKIIFLITGEHKSQVLKEVLEDDYQPEVYPIQYILKNNIFNVEIVADEAATKNLKIIK